MPMTLFERMMRAGRCNEPAEDLPMIQEDLPLHDHRVHRGLEMKATNGRLTHVRPTSSIRDLE